MATFFSILVGSFLLISLGLAPLSRLSDAVSKVTAKDFKLRIEPQKLPRELQPIAGVLSETAIRVSTLNQARRSRSGLSTNSPGLETRG